jgi:hypothetical protein
MTTPISLTAPLPSGPWTLYFHAPKEKRWTLDTFQSLGKMATLQDALGMFQELGDKLRRGMYFCMKDPIPPLWENYQNIRGGSYSVKVPSDSVKDVFTTQVLQAMLGLAFKEQDNTCIGISMSPKKGTFNIMKIWNVNSEKFNSPDGLCFLDYRCSDSEVLYTPHVQKRM